MKKTFTLLIVLLFATAGSWAQTSNYFNGFETTVGAGNWASTTIRANGYNGIPASADNFYGETGEDDFTRYGGYNSVFPALGYKTSIDMYLNVDGGYANDTRFDFSSAISKTDGDHLRDFVFSGGFYNDNDGLGANTNRFIFNVSNNTPGWPKNPTLSQIAISTTGWYTFEHYFHNNGSGVLAVDLNIYNSAHVLLGTWTLSDPTDIIGTTVGGNRYGWMVTNQLGTLAIDNCALTLVTPTPITTIGTPTSTACGYYDVPVTVADFTNVGNISLKMNYDPLVFAYQGATLNGVLPVATTFYSGTSGIFSLSYIGSGITLSDNDVLFTLHLKLLPAISGLSTYLAWSTVSGDCEYAGPGGTPVYTSTFNDLTWTIPTRPVKNTDTGLEYCTIQAAINAASPTNTITVAAGTYAEDIIVNKSLTILGPNANAGNNPCTGSRVLEAIVVPLTNAPSSGEIFHVTASNVTISGFTIDGDNPSLPTNGYGFAGADMHAAEGVTVYVDNVNNLHVTNNIFQNLSYYGVTLFGGSYSAPATTGHIVADNKFMDLGTYNVASGINGWGGGVLLYNNQYTAVTNNCMTNVRLGVQTGNFSQVNPGTIASQVISENTIQARKRGIFHNLFYNASPYTISGNTITGVANVNETTFWDGMLIASMTVASTASANTINGSAITTIPTTGIAVWNCQTAPLISLGTISGVGMGVNVNNFESYPLDPAGNTFATIDGVTINGATIAGIRVNDNPLNTNGATVFAEIKNIGGTGNATGILVNGADAGANIHNNAINATAMGINVNGPATSATNTLAIMNNVVTLTSQLSGTTPTVGVSLTNISGTQAALISTNNITGPFYGYMIYNLNTVPVTTITGGTITGIMQGVAAINIDPAGSGARAPSTMAVGNMAISNFTGTHAGSFHAGVYVYTGGAVANTAITATIDKVSVTGTGKITQDCAGLSFADFSTLASAGQNITVTECTLTDNLNRGINIRGANALVDVATSTLTGNGKEPYGLGGNDGFGIIVREGATANVHNNFITNPASVTGGYQVSALFTDMGTAASATINAHQNSLSQGGNLTSWLANNGSGTIDATCNWWGTTGPIPPLVSGVVTWSPFLIGGGTSGTPGFNPTAACENCIAMTLGETHVSVTCYAGSDGSIDLSVTGGAPTITYVWTTVGGIIPAGQEDDQDLTALTAGTYTVVVTDGNLCTQTISVVITVADATAPDITTCPPALTINGCSTADITIAYSTTLIVTDAATFTAAGGVASDNCSVTYYAYQDATATGTCPITVTRTWTIKDGMGLSATCDQTITVQDLTAPDWTAPVFRRDMPLANVNNAAGANRSNVNWADGTLSTEYYGDDFKLGSSTDGYWTINKVVVWGVAGDVSDPNFDLLDYFSDISLYSANAPKDPWTAPYDYSAVQGQATMNTVSTGTFGAGNVVTTTDGTIISVVEDYYYNGESYQGSTGIFRRIWKVTFDNLNLTVPAQQLITYGVNCTNLFPNDVTKRWYNHFSNITDGSAPFTSFDGNMLDFAPTVTPGVKDIYAVDPTPYWGKLNDNNVLIYGIASGAKEVNACVSSVPAGPDASAIAALFTDNCLGAVTATKLAPVITGTDCDWNVKYVYEIKDACGNIKLPNPTVDYQGGTTTPPGEIGGPVSATGGTVECETAPTPPGILPLVKNACGTTLTPSWDSPVIQPTNTTSRVDDFTSGVTLSANAAPGKWYVDRYAPAGFTTASYLGDNRLKESIDPAGPIGNFYATQGRKYNVGVNTVEIKLYVPQAWTLTAKRWAGLWGTAVDVNYEVSAYPIVEFTAAADVDGSGPRFRAYENGTWNSLGLPTGFAYDTWVTLKIQLLSGGEFLMAAGDKSFTTTTMSEYGSTKLNNVILQGHNAGTAYDIYWDDFTAVMCEGTLAFVYRYENCKANANDPDYTQFDWSYTYTVDHTTPPAQVGGPVANASNVECVTSATAPTVLPVVKDVCGVILTPNGPVEGGDYTTCEGTKSYSYTYTDCAGLTFVWTYTYTIEHITAPVVPTDGASTVSCPAMAVPPVAIPTIDQQQLLSNTSLTAPYWTDFTSIGQSFTPGTSGWLTQLDLKVGNIAATQNFTLYIYQGNGIGGTLLYTGSHSVSATGWQSLNIDQSLAPHLTAGVQYTFWLTAFTYNQLGLFFMYPNAYNGGVSMDGCTSGCSPTYAWQQWPDYDLTFKTYMTPIPVVTDVCGTVIPTPTPVVSTAPACEGTITYTYTYTDCSFLSSNWVYTYTIEREDFTMPANTTATVACVSAVVVPTPPVVTDACGNSITPVAGTTPTPPACEGDMVYSWTYTDCEGNNHVWKHTVTIEREPFTAITPTTATVACYAAIVLPTPPTVTDNCLNVLTPTGPVEGTVPACEGDVTYTWKYTDCEGNFQNYVHTVTIERLPFTDPTDAGSTVGSAALAVTPTLPAVTDNCGNTLTPAGPTMGGTMTGCTGTITYTYVYTDCEGNTNDWVYTYTVVTNTLSGKLKYNNSVKTTMNNVVVTLTASDLTTKTYTTIGDGDYTFTDLCPDTYTLTFANARTVGGINSTDAGAANAWWVLPNSIERVKFMAGDVNNSNAISAGDAQLIQKYFVFGPPTYAFARGPWTYWKSGVVSAVNPPSAGTPFTVVVASNMPNYDIYGMCTGDFNGSFIPSGSKSANSSLTLTYGGSTLVGANQAFELPIRTTSSMEVGAVSLILELPADLAEVTGVTVNGSTDPVTWTVNGNELRIGWNSVTPVNIPANGNLLTLNLKTTAAFTAGQSISIALIGDPLNELADASYDAIENAVLVVDVVDNLAVGIGQTKANPLSLSNYPNPFTGTTRVTYSIPVDGKVTLEVYTILGQHLGTLVDANQSAGTYSLDYKGDALQPGIYSVRLRLSNDKVNLERSIKLIVNE